MKEWAYCAPEIIMTINQENFGVHSTDLALICLFGN